MKIFNPKTAQIAFDDLTKDANFHEDYAADFEYYINEIRMIRKNHSSIIKSRKRYDQPTRRHADHTLESARHKVKVLTHRIRVMLDPHSIVDF